MERKRTRIDIIGDMLASIQNKGGEIKPTHLMYKSNMSHSQMNTYLDDLIQKDFVKKVKNSEYEYIAMTPKGHEFLQKLKEVKEFEKAFGL